MTKLRIGTCSWKYDSWQGLVYSENAKANYLKEYAQHFNTVEIDQWFWSLHGVDKISLPQPRVVEEYVNSVPKDFTFSIKVPNSITLTHFYKKTKRDPLKTNPHFLSLDLFMKFLENLQPMRNHLGPFMFQFEYLNKQKMPSQREFQEQFGEFISKCPQDYVYGVEIRNPNYLNKTYFGFLKQHNLHHVFLQGYYMPSIFPVYKNFSDHIEGITIIRLHGPDRKGIEQKSKKRWDTIIEAKDDELLLLTDMIRHVLSKNITTYLNINNHYEGSAPLTIEKIRKQLIEQ